MNKIQSMLLFITLFISMINGHTLTDLFNKAIDIENQVRFKNPNPQYGPGGTIRTRIEQIRDYVVRIPDMEWNMDKIPTMYPYVVNTIPKIQNQLQYSSPDQSFEPTQYRSSTIRYVIDGIEDYVNTIYNNYLPLNTYTSDVNDLKERIFELEFLVANISNTTLPEIKHFVDSIPQDLSTRVPTALYPAVSDIKHYVEDNIPTIISNTNQIPSIVPTITSRIPTDAPTYIPTIATINSNVQNMYDNYVHKSEYTSNVNDLKGRMHEIELLLANINNVALPDLKDVLDALHSRVQLRPTWAPTLSPTTDPTNDPTTDPTADPTTDPTLDPTADPTSDPTIDPTHGPTSDPTTLPSIEPTQQTDAPTVNPTMEPTAEPTNEPTMEPTAEPTPEPTNEPTFNPTKTPSREPTIEPTLNPSAVPTAEPTDYPSMDPSIEPTNQPSAAPTMIWLKALTLGGVDNSYNGEIIDINKTKFNLEFHNSQYFIIRRECDLCSEEYRELYYKRLKDPENFDAYSYMISFRVDNNKLWESDFGLYSSILDAIDGTNPWTFCYPGNEVTKGAFYGCQKAFNPDYTACDYPVDKQYYDALDLCNKPAKFSIFVGDPEMYRTQRAFVNQKGSITELAMDGSGVDKGCGDGDIHFHFDFAAKEFDIMMIAVFGVTLIVLNICTLRYGLCLFKKFGFLRYKQNAPKFDYDGDNESGIESGFKH